MKIILIVLAALLFIGLGVYWYETASPVAAPSAETEGMAEETNVPTQGKLDINVVCESALAYMTFKDNEAAAQFVAECKEGKHPEVIERYKADMNLGDGAAI